MTESHPTPETAAAVFGDTAMTIAGPGAPLVSEFCVAEFAHHQAPAEHTRRA